MSLSISDLWIIIPLVERERLALIEDESYFGQASELLKEVDITAQRLRFLYEYERKMDSRLPTYEECICRPDALLTNVANF